WYRSRHRFEAWWKSRPRRQRGGRPRKKLWPTPGGNATDRGSDGPKDCGCEKWAYGQYSFRAHFSAAPVGGKQSVQLLDEEAIEAVLHPQICIAFTCHLQTILYLSRVTLWAGF